MRSLQGSIEPLQPARYIGGAELSATDDLRGGVKVPTGGDAARSRQARELRSKPARHDLVRTQSRRSQSGWKKIAEGFAVAERGGLIARPLGARPAVRPVDEHTGRNVVRRNDPKENLALHEAWRRLQPAPIVRRLNSAKAVDERFMARALELAGQGVGLTAPNPMVGCVIVRDGQIVGEGWHRGAGLAHAEAEALREAGDRASGARAYVTLEPCRHHGRTPPCTDALVKAGVSEVVYAIADPHHLAAGGATLLQTSGVKVRAGVLETEARELNRAWLHSLKARRPFVVAKAAMSLDGRIAARSGESKWITGALARERAHELRRMADAIVVGAGTVIADDPALTARLDGEAHHPLRVVLDSTGRTPPGAKAYERSGRGAVLATTAAAPARRLDAFREHGVETLFCAPDAAGRPRLDDLLDRLYGRGVVTVAVEGGGETLGAFLDHDLVDEVWLFLAPLLIGGGPPAFAGVGPERLSDIRRFDFGPPESLGPDLFIRGVRIRGGG